MMACFIYKDRTRKTRTETEEHNKSSVALKEQP